jgi:hypothetical protein
MIVDDAAIEDDRLDLGGACVGVSVHEIDHVQQMATRLIRSSDERIVDALVHHLDLSFSRPPPILFLGDEQEDVREARANLTVVWGSGGGRRSLARQEKQSQSDLEEEKASESRSRAT